MGKKGKIQCFTYRSSYCNLIHSVNNLRKSSQSHQINNQYVYIMCREDIDDSIEPIFYSNIYLFPDLHEKC